jgi:hypothetical protein
VGIGERGKEETKKHLVEVISQCKGLLTCRWNSCLVLSYSFISLICWQPHALSYSEIWKNFGLNMSLPHPSIAVTYILTAGNMCTACWLQVHQGITWEALTMLPHHIELCECFSPHNYVLVKTKLKKGSFLSQFLLNHAVKPIRMNFHAVYICVQFLYKYEAISGPHVAQEVFFYTHPQFIPYSLCLSYYCCHLCFYRFC